MYFSCLRPRWDLIKSFECEGKINHHESISLNQLDVESQFRPRQSDRLGRG